VRTPGESSALRIPLAVWLATVVAVAGLAAAFGYNPFHAETWSRYDSIHYEDIARDGYELVRCPPGVWEPGAWCGDSGWFPGYSWVVGVLHKAGLPLRGSAVAVSWAFAAATLLLLWNTFFGRRRDVALVAALVYAAWAPGQIYGYSIFPLSMLAFFTVAWLWLLGRGRFVGAGLAGAAAVLSYPLGVLVIPVSVVWIIVRRRAVLTAALASAGLGVLFVDQAIETGHWNAYSLVQRNYGHHLLNPVASLRDQLRPLWSSSELTHVGPALQALLVTAVIVALLVQAWRRRPAQTELLVLLWGVVAWLVPLSQSYVSLQRSQAALLPLAVLLPRLPRPVVIALAVAAIAVAVAMEKLFLDGKIV
jgi:hypothetical protein